MRRSEMLNVKDLIRREKQNLGLKLLLFVENSYLS